MKSNRILLAFTIVMIFALQSCLKDDCERTVSYINLEPVYKTLDEIHAGTAVREDARAFEDPGQFYYYADHIFVNERKKGIHIIDNTDPANPVTVTFLSIPGNTNMAIKNGILYANSYIDLLAIDLQTYQAVGHAESVFPPIWQDVNSGDVLVDYKEVPITEVMDCETYSSLNKANGNFFAVDVSLVSSGVVFDDFAIPSSEGAINNNGGAGIGGSMARFTIMGDYLYAIDDWKMELFDLSSPANPTSAGTVEIGWGIETIFPYEDKLFIGSNNGMFIYDNSDPTNPVQLSAFAHARACDPVFVSGNYAYVTLRSGNECNGFVNQLDLIDITELTDPKLIESFPMDNPHGLSIKNNNLYLCEGEFGIKSFDISDPNFLDDNLLDQIKGVNAWDAISLPGNQDVLLIIGEDGFYQYDVSDPADIDLMSKIEVIRK